MLNLDQHFMAAVIEAHDSHPSGRDVLPMLLAQACVQVLGVTGAGVSIIDDELRIPLGVSDAIAAQAEILQTTLGEGPCLEAVATSELLVADETAIAARWPLFHRELRAQTPIRAVASIPLKSTQLRPVGALDLYATNSRILQQLSLNEVSANVGDPIAAILFDARPTIVQDGTIWPVWMSSEPVAQRMNVWVAVGILIEHAGLTNADALAALRGYAFSHDASLDDVAHQMITKQLHADAILGG